MAFNADSKAQLLWGLPDAIQNLALTECFDSPELVLGSGDTESEVVARLAILASRDPSDPPPVQQDTKLDPAQHRL